VGARRVGTSVILAVVLAGLTGPAVAAGPAGDTETRAAAAATRVARLTAEYRRHAVAAAAASVDLTRAYAALAAAERDADASGRVASGARSERAGRTLALYAFGVGVRSELALLGADSLEDGLWRLTVGGPVAEVVLSGSLAAERAAATRAADDAATSQSVQAATDRLGLVLGRVREEETAARLALEAARAEFRRLDARARAERAAREAAAELARAQAAAAGGGPAAGTPMAALAIPTAFESAYRRAATTCPGMAWTLLAAVGQVESGHGRNNGPSSAGAIGPMQFMPATFAAYGVDGDGDGVADAWDAEDAVFSAARYLCASGAGTGPDGVHRALFAYNHAQWYVDLVLSAQRAIAAAHPA
jgi:hypothetical protein